LIATFQKRQRKTVYHKDTKNTKKKDSKNDHNDTTISRIAGVVLVVSSWLPFIFLVPLVTWWFTFRQISQAAFNPQTRAVG
jgi:ATP-dependent Zn protease